MDAKQTALADYVLILSESLEHTHHANDRHLYQAYLADAAVILALLVRGAESEQIQSPVADHERRWAQTWLVGPEHVAVGAAWGVFKKTL